MAQRTGAERFLAPLAKSASAGAALALALAAFLLCGCGGGSSSDLGSTVSTSASRASGFPGDSPPGVGTGATAGVKASQVGKGAGAASQAASFTGQTSGGRGQKHGPRIAAPKGPPEQAPSPKEVADATVADMRLESPEIVAQGGSPGTLPASFTCDGNDTWPALHWSGVPAGTVELIVYAMSMQPVEERLFVDWAVAGLDPGLSGIEAGKLPKGAIVGTNGFGKAGYEICPKGAEIYMFAVYALPSALFPPRGFDARELRRRILDVSGNVGLLPALYARG